MLNEHARCFIEIGSANESIYLVSDGKREMLTGLRNQSCKLIRYMMEQNAANGGAARIISHSELLNAVWGRHRISNGNMQIARLVFEIRKAIADLDKQADLIQSVPGQGYILRDGCSRERADDYPFVCGPPITHPRRFFGRINEVKRIFVVWNRFPLQHFALIGPKRSGKTSLLHFLRSIQSTPQAELRPDQASALPLMAGKLRMVFIDCQDPRLQSPAPMMSYILEQLGIPAQRTCSLSAFAECISELSHPTVLLFDELEAALFNPEFDERFWMGLRSLANHGSAGRLGYAIAVHPELGSLVSTQTSTSPFLNIFGHLLQLGPLTGSEARELIDSSPKPFSEDDVQWILSQSGRHPCLLQLLCDTRLTAIQENQSEDQWKKEGLARISHFPHLLSHG